MALPSKAVELKLAQDKVTKISELPEEVRCFLVGYGDGPSFKETDTINTVVAGRTPLTFAAGYNMPDVALELLKFPEIDIHPIVPEITLGPQLNTWGRGENALAIFIHYFNEEHDKSGARWQVIKTLIERSPKAAKNFVVPFGVNQGSNLLHLAAMTNSKKLLTLLLDLGMDINSALPDLCNTIGYHEPSEPHQRDCDSGETAIHIAAKNCNSESVKYLLDRKANVNAMNTVGLTPLDRTEEYVDRLFPRDEDEFVKGELLQRVVENEQEKLKTRQAAQTAAEFTKFILLSYGANRGSFKGEATCGDEKKQSEKTIGEKQKRA